MSHDEIRRQMSALDSDMLERRKALNQEHYYPRLKPIQDACAALGHVKGRHVVALVQNYFVCGYCGAAMEETREEGGTLA